jgi:hypothetical protein
MFPVCFIDMGKAHGRQRIEAWIHSWEAQRSNSLTQFKATIQNLDQEADRLADRLKDHIEQKRKRDFEIRLLKGELEKRKKCRLGFLQKNFESRGKGTQRKHRKMQNIA